MLNNFKLKYFKSFFCFLYLICFQLLNGKEQYIPTNDIKIGNINSDYNFLVGGHLYGDPRQTSSPASTLLLNIQNFNQLNPLFFISLGDNYRSANDVNIKQFFNSFVEKLNFPFLTIAGNHDVTDRKKFNEYFGRSYYDFSVGSEHFIILDSEFESLENQRRQIKYFDELIIKISQNNIISNVFILTHKLLWADLLNKYDIVFQNSNNTSLYDNQVEFGENILKSLDIIKNLKNIFWLSGDVGIWRSFPLFYEKDIKEDITFVATGLGDTKNDMILSIAVQNGEITMEALALNGLKRLKVEKYNSMFWKKLFAKKSNPQNIISTFKIYIQKFKLKETILYIMLTFFIIFLFFITISIRRCND